MDNNNQFPAMNPTAAPGQKKVGPIIAILVIVLIVIIAAIYLFSSPGSEGNTPALNETVPTLTSSSDEVTDIQSDLESATAGLDTQNF